MLKNTKGFTLVELSVVIVVIGLLVAGLLGMKSVLRGAELKVMVKEVNQLRSKVRDFTMLYEALPGDFVEATEFWGVSTSNGNGDGQIAEADETYAAFDQMALADLIDGEYTGVAGSGLAYGIPGTPGNIMSSDVDGVGFLVRCCGDNSLAFKNNINVFVVDKDKRRSGAFSPLEAFLIDQKQDDGNPDAGYIGANGNWSGGAYAKTNCFSNSGASATYDSTADHKHDLGCQMLFAFDWE